jgi:hypothetical protein
MAASAIFPLPILCNIQDQKIFLHFHEKEDCFVIEQINVFCGVQVKALADLADDLGDAARPPVARVGSVSTLVRRVPRSIW